MYQVHQLPRGWCTTSDILPASVDTVLAVETSPVLLGCFIRPGEDAPAAVPADLGGDSLPDFTLRLRIDKQVNIGVGVDIDESRRNRQTAGVDDLPCMLCGNAPANLHDTVAQNGDIRLDSGTAETVIHCPAPYHEVVRRSLLTP